MVVIDLIYNLCVLVALSILSGFIDVRYSRKTLSGKILQGLLFGLIAVLGMMNPYVMTQGIIFDGRSIVISLCTLFFGPVSGLIAALLSLIYRIYLGGGGLIMGTGVIVFSFFTGYLFYSLKIKNKIKFTTWNLYIFGLIVHVLMATLIITLPTKYVPQVYDLLIFTILAIYPFISLLVSKVLLDNLEKKIFYQELKESERKFKAAFYTSPDSINLNKLDGEYVEVNEGFINLTGYSYEDVKGKNSLDLNIWVNNSDRKRMLDLLLENGKVENLEADFRCKNGSIVHGLMSATIVDIDQEPHILNVTRDFTIKKNAELALINAKELAEKSNKLKTAFLQNMSHEIRTPLNGIIGFASLLNDKDISLDDVAEYSKIIHKSGNRLLNLLNNIIDIAKIESGTIKLQYSAISVIELILEQIEQFKALAAEKDIDLIFIEEENSLKEEIYSDSLRLNQIFTNLIHNAIKFTDKGTVSISGRVFGSEILFEIRDTGKGIAKEHLDKIFERFYQVSDSPNRQYEGAGLGLAICKGLVDALEGRIWAESEPGKGTSFFFTIPFRTKMDNHKPMGSE